MAPVTDAACLPANFSRQLCIRKAIGALEINRYMAYMTQLLKSASSVPSAADALRLAPWVLDVFTQREVPAAFYKKFKSTAIAAYVGCCVLTDKTTEPVPITIINASFIGKDDARIGMLYVKVNM
jgi:hypothetical protein